MGIRNLAVRFRRSSAMAVQLTAVALTNLAAFALRFDGAPPDWAAAACAQMLPWLLVIRGLTFVPFRLYDGLWRYAGIYDLRAIVGAVLTSSLIFAAVTQSSFGPAVYPRSVFIGDALLLVLLGGLRLARRLYGESSGSRQGRRILVFGAGNAGELIVRDMKVNRDCGYEPVGFVDDDQTKVGRRIHGVPVLGTRHDFKKI